jgi:aspartyl-tRNA(Asn)/glutamyl-tRNA(Gln) amidotransferase subunit C
LTHATAVKEIAVLARLSISDEDIETATTEFSQTLALFDALSSVDTNQVTPMVNPLDAVQRLRIDSVETLVDRDGLMRNAPAQDQHYFLVPRVLD